MDWKLSGRAGLAPVLIAFAIWCVLHAAFLWTGIFVYGFSCRSFGQPIKSAMLRRATFVAPLVFLPAIAATYILMGLYSYPGLTTARLAATPLGQIADLRFAADVLRLPYCFALLCGLWSAVPRSIRAAQLDETIDDASDEQTPIEQPDARTTRRFLASVVVAGFVNAMICGFILCKLPSPHGPGFIVLLSRAMLLVAVGTLAGIGGSWFYWRSVAIRLRARPPLPFALFAIICASGWMWIPAMVLFLSQLSAAGALAAMFAALALGSSLRRETYPVFAAAETGSLSKAYDEGELFAESLYQPPWQFHGYLIALGLYCAGAAIVKQDYYTAAATLAASAFLFAWLRGDPQSTTPHRAPYKRAIARVAWMSVPAVIVTMWALLEGFAHHADGDQVNTAQAASAGKSTSQQSPGSNIDGYESVILWPYAEKKQIIAPIPPSLSLLAPGTVKPLVIRFNGPYWFLQAPHVRPGSNAHQAHGSPLDVNIRSNNFIPLAMDAHQYLPAPIPTRRLREVQVDIENSDNRPGIISLAVLLEDASLDQNHSVYLGQQPLTSALPVNFSPRHAPAHETLHFVVPAKTKLPKFNEITVVVLSDQDHAFQAPRISIQQFQLFPR